MSGIVTDGIVDGGMVFGGDHRNTIGDILPMLKAGASLSFELASEFCGAAWKRRHGRRTGAGPANRGSQGDLLESAHFQALSLSSYLDRQGT
jgi:hypothetical protein